MTRCRVCRRPLTSPDSQAAGVGPTCAKAGVVVEKTRVKIRPDGRQSELWEVERDGVLRGGEVHMVANAGSDSGEGVFLGLVEPSSLLAEDEAGEQVIDFDALRRRVTP